MRGISGIESQWSFVAGGLIKVGEGNARVKFAARQTEGDARIGKCTRKVGKLSRSTRTYLFDGNCRIRRETVLRPQ